MAQKPMAMAAVVRTNWARVIPILRRQRSVSRSASRMINICSRVGGGGKYSSFDAGRMSTGRSSGMSGHECRWGPLMIDGPDRFQLITESPLTVRPSGAPQLITEPPEMRRA